MFSPRHTESPDSPQYRRDRRHIATRLVPLITANTHPPASRDVVSKASVRERNCTCLCLCLCLCLPDPASENHDAGSSRMPSRIVLHHLRRAGPDGLSRVPHAKLCSQAVVTTTQTTPHVGRFCARPPGRGETDPGSPFGRLEPLPAWLGADPPTETVQGGNGDERPASGNHGPVAPKGTYASAWISTIRSPALSIPTSTWAGALAMTASRKLRA